MALYGELSPVVQDLELLDAEARLLSDHLRQGRRGEAAAQERPNLFRHVFYMFNMFLSLVALLELLHGPDHLHAIQMPPVCSMSPKQQQDPHQQGDPVP